MTMTAKCGPSDQICSIDSRPSFPLYEDHALSPTKRQYVVRIRRMTVRCQRRTFDLTAKIGLSMT